jgi:large repetitive protein
MTAHHKNGAGDVLGASAMTVTVGQPLTFTATVTGTNPTGDVTFKDGAATLGIGTLINGHASYATGSLTIGNHNVTALYGGDANNGASTSAAITATVRAASASGAGGGRTGGGGAISVADLGMFLSLVGACTLKRLQRVRGHSSVRATRAISWA